MSIWVKKRWHEATFVIRQSVQNIPETKEQEAERHRFAEELFRLSCIPTHLLSDEEFNKVLNSIKKPKHMA